MVLIVHKGHGDGLSRSRMQRRQVLASSAAVVGLAGCLADRVPRSSPTGSPESDSPTPVSQSAGGEAPSIQWTREYGADGEPSRHTPNGDPALGLRAVAGSGDGGYAVTGQLSESGGNRSTPLLVTDSGGEARWLRRYGGRGLDRAYSVVRTTDGGFLLAGIRDPSSPGTSGTTDGPSTTGWVVKVDAGGGPTWQATPAEDRRSAFEGAVQTSDGGYALSGWTTGEDGTRGWFVRLSATGERLVSRSYDQLDADPAAIAERFRSVVETADGNFVLAGDYVDGGWVTKVAPDGSVQWEILLDAPYVSANDVLETGDGNYLVTGRVTNADQAHEYTVTAAENPSDLSLMLVEHSGTVRWTKLYDGGGNEFGNAVAATGDGGFVAVGGRTPRRERGVFAVETDGEGIPEWTGTYLTEESARGRGVVPTEDGGLAIAADSVFLKLGPR